MQRCQRCGQVVQILDAFESALVEWTLLRLKRELDRKIDQGRGVDEAREAERAAEILRRLLEAKVDGKALLNHSKEHRC